MRYVASNTHTEAEIREGQVRTLKLRLLGYVVRTPIAEDIRISYVPPNAEAPAGPVDDPWNYWVSRVAVGRPLLDAPQPGSRAGSGTCSGVQHISLR